MTPTLSQRLRNETRDAHVRAERAGIMRRLLRGEIDRESYILMMRNLESVYRALESGLAHHATHAALSFIDLRAVGRLATIETDLDALSPSGWHAIPLTRAATEYAARLRDLDASRPELLLAHAYLRYLGDLSGGRVMRGIVARALSLTDGRGGKGLAFYDYPAIVDADAFKTGFRASLDTASVPHDEMVSEVMAGYALHERMFEELDAGDAV